MLSQRAARGRHPSACKNSVLITVTIRAWLQIHRADVLAMIDSPRRPNTENEN